jgi:hypothetical protein
MDDNLKTLFAKIDKLPDSRLAQRFESVLADMQSALSEQEAQTQKPPVTEEEVRAIVADLKIGASKDEVEAVVGKIRPGASSEEVAEIVSKIKLGVTGDEVRAIVAGANAAVSASVTEKLERALGDMRALIQELPKALAAAKAPSGPPPTYTFDVEYDVLEERIKRIVARPATMRH